MMRCTVVCMYFDIDNSPNTLGIFSFFLMHCALREEALTHVLAMPAGTRGSTVGVELCAKV